jgi:hypothetical protein
MILNEHNKYHTFYSFSKYMILEVQDNAGITNIILVQNKTG